MAWLPHAVVVVLVRPPTEDNLEDEAVSGAEAVTARFCTIFRSRNVVWLDDDLNWAACKVLLVAEGSASRRGRLFLASLVAAKAVDLGRELALDVKAFKAMMSADSF